MKQQTTNSALFLVPTMLHAITKINHDHLHLTTILSSGRNSLLRCLSV